MEQRRTLPQQQSDGGGPSAYNRIPQGEETTLVVPHESSSSLQSAKFTYWNFVMMSVLFSANHGCTVACLALATARLGRVGAWQSGTLYLTYTASAVMGATYIVKKVGARNSIMWGMALYCAYVGCFFIATLAPMLEVSVALLGAAIGGVGGGFLWTAQGAYFAKAAQVHYEASILEWNGNATTLDESSSSSTSLFAGVFAFIYLTEEVALRALSTALLAFGISWGTIFGIYTLVAVLSTFGMVWVYNYNDPQDIGRPQDVWFKVTAAWQLLKNNAKMKYMIGLNAVFGFAGAFLNSYVNGQVVRLALHDEESKYVGILSSLVAAVAAICSLLFARLAQGIGKGPILIMGSVAFFLVAFPFIVIPNVAKNWNLGMLIFIYTLHGVGRSTFESTLKAVFVDYFPEEKEGAFANIILQNGLSSAIGFFLTFRLTCVEESTYCVAYTDGTLHNVLAFELLVVITAVLAILGYWRASSIYKAEQQHQGEAELLENTTGTSA